MSEKRKEKKLLNALTLILDLCCKEDVERSGKTKSNIPLEKSFAIHTKVGGKDGDVGH